MQGKVLYQLSYIPKPKKTWFNNPFK